ncbi:nitroreductase/quinone reductase family protein [Nonomuraea soli]|uniref:Deazaflavin-dependent oxidoreductase (Nitroreductase family) n=1 Tax=Nonomuraea soli TaxID=1032476 RepID=A0A7W0CTD7_9ACTN|nr:nitroreductase/quinone reductase family protein [Nonomuraea soli]MBA2896853.1 deazaflavin-dependent oxidoreductase (nitroreductase family) [Nonomuraea soli]
MDFAQADALNQAIRLLSLRHRARAATLLAPLGLHTGQEALLLELARTGPMIQAQLSDALGCEPPSVTLMTRKLEATGHIRRVPTPADKRATVVELTESGRALTEQIKDLWLALAEETVVGLPPETVSALPELLNTLTANVDSRRPRAVQNRAPLETEPTSHPDAANRVSALAGTYEPSASAWVREHVEQIMRTGTTDGVTIKGLPTVLVTYRGAKTGSIRKTPLMRVEHEGHYAAVASQGGAPRNPQWYSSLVAEPLVEVQDGTASRGYRAREVFGQEKELWWRRAVDAYPDYADYQLRTERQIPVFVLEPIDGELVAGASADNEGADLG